MDLTDKLHPFQDDPVHQLLLGMIDELVAIKDYRIRSIVVNDLETAQLYTDITYEEVEHLGEFLTQLIKLDPLFKDHLIVGMNENRDEKELTEEIETEE